MYEYIHMHNTCTHISTLQYILAHVCAYNRAASVCTYKYVYVMYI